MGKGFWIALVLILAIMIGGFLLLDDSEPVAELENPHEIEAGVDHTIGSPDAPVTLVKYSDFQCSFCRDGAIVLEEVRDQFSEDELQFVYRHSPFLTHAFDAARASEAAARQGAFWEMHDALFINFDEWSDSTNARSIFEELAADIGLDVDQYNEDFTDVSSRVERDVQIRNQLEVTGTPTYFINGERIDNPVSLEAFVEVLEDALAEAEAEEASENGEEAVWEEDESEE